MLQPCCNTQGCSGSVVGLLWRHIVLAVMDPVFPLVARHLGFWKTVILGADTKGLIFIGCIFVLHVCCLL